jgi:hypothetical protein
MRRVTKIFWWRAIVVGQTGRDFKTRYKENINASRQNVEKSRYAIHMLKKITNMAP